MNSHPVNTNLRILVLYCGRVSILHEFEELQTYLNYNKHSSLIFYHCSSSLDLGVVRVLDFLHFPDNLRKRRETFSSEADQSCTMIKINAVWANLNALGSRIPSTFLLHRQISLS